MNRREPLSKLQRFLITWLLGVPAAVWILVVFVYWVSIIIGHPIPID